MTHPPVLADQPGRPRRHRRRPWITRLIVLAGSAFLLVAAGGAAIPAVAAAASSGARDGRATHSTARAKLIAAEPFGDYVNRLSFDVTSIDPALVTAAGPKTLNITGTMTNAGPEPLTDLSYRFQRGASLGSDADVRQELSAPSEPTEQVQRTFTQIPGDLAAGASAPFAFSAAIADPDGLDVDTPGVYPLMVNVNGAVTLEAGPLEARVGELHLLLTVMGVPGAAPAVGDGADVGTVTTKALPVNFVWPLVDRPHLGVGGVFLDDELQAAVSPGGRLSILLDGLTDAAASRLPAGSVTVVIDPQLLDELDRMTSAYRVVAPATDGDRAEPQPPMTALVQAAASAAATAAATAAPATTQTAAATAPPGDTTTTSPEGPSGTAGAGTPGETGTSAVLPDLGSVDVAGTVAGTGQVAAASYLGRLREVAARYPVVLLPYGDPDVVALVRAGLSDQVSTAVQHGQEVARRVLGDELFGDAATTGASTVSTSTAYPINGATDAETLAALHADGLGTALLSESSVRIDGSEVGAAAVALPGTDQPVPAVIAQPDVLNGFDALIDQGRQSGWATRVNALTGVLAQQSLDGTVTPAVFMPDRRWSPDAPGLQVITELLGTLGASQVIAGIRLSDLAASGSTPATTDYPAQARAAELSAEYLDRISASRADVASLRQTFASTKQTSDPNLVLDPLDLALDDAASTAFRSDPAVGEANLSTVEETTAGLRTGVQISSAGNSYTLASSTSPLVLTVQNNLPYDVPVRVQISGGERVGLTVSDPGIQVVPAGRSQQVKIPAEVSRSGQFQVSAQLVGEDGTAWGPPVQLSVNSTAYGALTVILIAGAGGVLLLMVALRIVQRIRGRADAPGDAPRGQGRNPEDDRLDSGIDSGSDADLDAGRQLRDVIQATDASTTTPLDGTPLTGRNGTHRTPSAAGSPGVPAEQVGRDRS